jgi:hypothetical protein
MLKKRGVVGAQRLLFKYGSRNKIGITSMVMAIFEMRFY